MPGVQWLVIVVALVAFWAIVMRPARVQQRRVQDFQQGLEVGDEVVLTSGIFGTIHSLSEGRVELEIAPGTVITVARQVVVRRAEAQDESVAGPAEDSVDPPAGGSPDEQPPQAQD